MDNASQPRSEQQHEAAPIEEVDTATGRDSTIHLLARDIKISHSVFALPFALLAAFLARDVTNSWGTFAGQMVLIVACMVSARTAAMLANRILDHQIDARNPRTAGRAIASGRVAVRDALVYLLGTALVFIAFCAAFGFLFDNNWWPFLLSIPVLLWICAYPLLKRHTWWCHVYLGSSLAISPLAAAIAIRPTALAEHAALWIISAMVLLWVAGFDVMYALQDIDIDREQGLHSMPSRFGRNRALWISRVMHMASFVTLTLVVLDDRLRTIWFVTALTLVAVLLVAEHYVLARHGTAKIQLAFFTLNGIISCIVGAAGIASILLHDA